ncbi:LysE family translocator [Thalassotalea aquiviva]|uniref:LysE family translocator n=1 Tax=Thalassotalea aquiviva TaxID=3242415 RepID=UPI00352B6FD7
MDFMPYWDEFVIIVVVHFLAVASPGPDFAIVVKQSLGRGRKHALLTSAGIGTGILLHVTYSLIGIGLLIHSSPTLFKGLTYIAAAYLGYLGVMGIMAKPQTPGNDNQSIAEKPQTLVRAYLTGFLVNGLNVKATLFFVSLFSLVISSQTPIVVQSVYGLYMAVATGLWFCFISYLLTTDHLQKRVISKGYIIDRLMGVVLIFLALNIAFGG